MSTEEEEEEELYIMALVRALIYIFFLQNLFYIAECYTFWFDLDKFKFI